MRWLLGGELLVACCLGDGVTVGCDGAVDDRSLHIRCTATSMCAAFYCIP
jgi:hypothetical protein